MVIAIVAGIVLGIMIMLRARQQYSLVQSITHEKHRTRLLRHYSVTRLMIKTTILLIGTGALTIALMRPQQMQEMAYSTKGRDIIVMLDISRSMLAQDNGKERLSCAKEKIKDVLQQLPADRIGLMVFAGDACMLCPLTEDHDTFMSFLNDVDKDMMSSSSTSFSNALRSLIDRCVDTQASSRLGLLITDGEDFSDIPQSVFDELHHKKIYIGMLGMGSGEGAPIPDSNQPGSYIKNDTGTVVITRRDDERLELLATRCHGCYAPCDVNGNKDVEMLCAWIKKFEQQVTQCSHMRYQEENFMKYGLIAFTAFLIEMVA